MYHIDPNLNTALERQAERVRAVQAVGQSHGRTAAAFGEAIADLPDRPQPTRLWRWWPAVAVLLIGLRLALVAWTRVADGALVAWV